MTRIADRTRRRRIKKMGKKKKKRERQKAHTRIKIPSLKRNPNERIVIKRSQCTEALLQNLSGNMNNESV